MARLTKTMIVNKCDVCGHEWINKDKSNKPPISCAKCKTPYWNRGGGKNK